MATQAGDAPGLIYYNGNVITVDPQFPRAEAVAIQGNKFAAVGRSEEVRRLAGPKSRPIDLKGKTVIPGIIDAHVHAAHGGMYLLPKFVQFDDCRSIDDMLTAIAAKAEATPAGEWVLGSAHFDYDLIKEKRFPNRWELDRAVPHHPFFLRIRGHLGVTNSKGLEAFRITEETLPPSGGYIFKDPETGKLNGWLLDNTVYHLVLPQLPRATAEDWINAIKAMNRRLLREGITSIVNQSGEVLRFLKELRGTEGLPVRWQANLVGSSNYFHQVTDIAKAVRDLGAVTGEGDAWLRVGSIGELHCDGLIEAPWMHEPYAGDKFGPDWKGLLRHDRETLLAICNGAADIGYQMEVHASGDAAMELVLDVYESVNKRIPIRERRWLITHGGIFPTPRSVERARNLGVIVSTQQPVLWTQSHYYKQFWGEKRVANLFANRTWLEGGVRINGSTDVGMSPMIGMYMYVTRKNFFGEALGPEQAISREAALKAYTIDGAYSTFEEKIKGTIEVGKLADLVVLSDDPLAVPEEKIKEIQVLATVVDGKIAYEREAA